MPPAVLLYVGIVLIACAVIANLVALGVAGRSSKAVRARLSVAAPVTVQPEPDVVVRLDNAKSGVLHFLTTATAIHKIQRNLVLAGRPDAWTLRRILIAKPILVGVAALALFTFVSKGSSTMIVLTGIIGVIGAYFVPDILIKKRAEARQAIIQQELPDVLDQVTISIEAGLGFEAAFARIGDRRSGPLADEIVRTVQDMRLGMNRRDAYQSLADRTDVEDMRRFVKSIVHAEKYGVSMASVVRTQAVEMRYGRRKRAEERALKVPVKVLFPLLVCILPVLFIVVLTPAVVSLGQSM